MGRNRWKAAPRGAPLTRSFLADFRCLNKSFTGQAYRPQSAPLWQVAGKIDDPGSCRSFGIPASRAKDRRWDKAVNVIVNAKRPLLVWSRRLLTPRGQCRLESLSGCTICHRSSSAWRRDGVAGKGAKGVDIYRVRPFRTLLNGQAEARAAGL